MCVARSQSDSDAESPEDEDDRRLASEIRVVTSSQRTASTTGSVSQAVITAFSATLLLQLLDESSTAGIEHYTLRDGLCTRTVRPVSALSDVLRE